MSDVFISYAREDRAWVEGFAAALERAGLSTWWDIRNRPGLSFDDQIEQALGAAKAVVVVWSAHSLGSRWVKAEAGVALDRDILIPVLKDNVAPPLVFRQLHCANLSAWDGGPHVEMDDLVRELKRLTGDAPAAEPTLVAEPLPVVPRPAAAGGDHEPTLFQPRPLQMGDIVGHYRIIAPLGQGGSGAIYQASNIHNEHERVALKIVLPDIPDRDRFLEFLRDEANALQRVRNDAVVQYRTFGRIPDSDEFFLVIEHIEGPTLGAALRAAPIPPDALRRLAVRLCAGLEAAHAQGVIHRDLSPDNVILPGGEIDRAIIIDFGIARNGAFDPMGEGFAGKLSYAAPEQFQTDAAQIGPWTDLYSLGLVLAAAASGKKLAMGTDMASAIASRHAVPSLASVPAELRAPIAALLEPHPTMRVRLAKDAAALFAPQPAPAKPPEPAPPVRVAPAADAPVVRDPRPPSAIPERRAPWLTAALTTAAVFILLGGGTYWFLNRGEQPAEPSAIAAAAPPDPRKPDSSVVSPPVPAGPPAATPESPPSATPAPVPDPQPSAPVSEPEAVPVPKPAPKAAPAPPPEIAPPAPASPAPPVLDPRLKTIVTKAKKAAQTAERAAAEGDFEAAKAVKIAAAALEAEASAQTATKTARAFAKQACGPNPPPDLQCPPFVRGVDHFAGQTSCTDDGQCGASRFYVLTEATGTIDEGRWQAGVLKEGCITRSGAVEYCGSYNGAYGRSGPGLAYASSYTIAADWAGPNPSSAYFCFDFSKAQDGSSRLCGNLADPTRRIGVADDVNGRLDRGTFFDMALTLGILKTGSPKYEVAAQFGSNDAEGSIKFSDGRLFWGRIAYLDDGYVPLEGVMYAADGAIQQQGKWKDGVLAVDYGAGR